MFFSLSLLWYALYQNDVRIVFIDEHMTTGGYYPWHVPSQNYLLIILWTSVEIYSLCVASQWPLRESASLLGVRPGGTKYHL